MSIPPGIAGIPLPLSLPQLYVPLGDNSFGDGADDEIDADCWPQGPVTDDATHFCPQDISSNYAMRGSNEKVKVGWLIYCDKTCEAGQRTTGTIKVALYKDASEKWRG